VPTIPQKEENMKHIEIIVPCKNEEKCIDMFVDAIKETFDSMKDVSFSILFIDDGSTDKTMDKIRSQAKICGSDVIRYISFSRNFGKESALYAGMSNCKGDYIAIMDADLQHPPKLLPKMLEAIEKEGYDCAGARRVSRKGEPVIRSAFSKSFYYVINWATGMNLVPGMTDYRLMRMDVVKSICLLTERERFIKGIYSWVGYKTKWIEYENVERAAGETKWSMRGLFNYAKSGFIAFATAPLRGVIYLGIFTVLISLIYAIHVYINIRMGLREWTDSVTIIMLLLFIGGVLIAILGVIGEYLARIYMEVKDRPIYISRESNVDKDKE